MDQWSDIIMATVSPFPQMCGNGDAMVITMSDIGPLSLHSQETGDFAGFSQSRPNDTVCPTLIVKVI